ncbi:hypothetical protein AB751O23_BM_00010, partial [Chlamydiales bacterium SCGC AB-751-O23]
NADDGITIGSDLTTTVGDININDNMTSVAAMTIAADSDANGTGDFNLATGAAVNSGGTEISIEANDVSLLGTINAGIANLLLWTSDGGTIGLGAATGQGMSISGAELQKITASEFHLGHADSGNIVVDGITGANSANIADKVLLQGTGTNKTVTFNGSGSTFRTLTVNADDGIIVDSDLTTTVGALELDADIDDLGDGDLTVATSKTINTQNAAATITANDITLDGSLNTGTGALNLLVSDGGTIGLGDADKDFDISAAGLGRITSGATQIGDVTSGSITVNNVSAANSDGISGMLTLDATKDTATILFETAASIFNSLTAKADEGITVNADLTTDIGNMILDADVDDLGDGDLTVAVSKTISTGNATGTITANDIILDGSLSTGTGALNLLVSDGGAIGLGDVDKDYDLSKLELSRITSGVTQIGDSTSSSITVDNVAESDSDGISGMLTLDATKDDANITFQTVASTFNSLTAKADDGIILNVDLTTDTGAMVLEADNDGAEDTATTGDRIYLNGARTLTSAGNMTLDATTTKISGTSTIDLSAVGAININDSMTSVGAVTMTADSDADGAGNFNLASGAEVNSGGTQISLEANDVSLLGTINAGIANLLLWTSDTGSIGLGSVSGQGMSISGAELQKMTASELHLGHADSGSIVVNGITVANSANIADRVLMQATGDDKSVTFNSTASSFRALRVEADDGITVGSNLTATVGDLELDADIDNVADVSDALTLASGITLSTTSATGNITLDATGGSVSSVGGVSILSLGNVDVNDSLTTAGTTVITADSDGLGDGDLTLVTSMTIDTQNAAATITANDIVLDGSLDTGTGALNLLVSDGGTIGLGDADKDYNLSKLELSRITSGTTQIGNSTSGSITVDNVSASDSDGISGMLTLDATKNGSNIVFETIASVFNSLTAKADDGIDLSVDLTTDVGNMILEADNDNSADTAVTGDRIYLTGARTLTSAGNMTLNATTTKISGTSSIDLSAVGAININDDMTSVGAVTITADSDANGSGNFNLATGAELNSGGTQISLEANDLSLLGTLNAGIANLLLWTSDGGSIGLGSVGGQGMSISGAELQNMTASELHLGHADSGSIVVNGITIANSANIADKALLQATGDNKSVTFNSTASSFRTLTVNADDGITVGSNLTATVGDLKLEADVDNAADASDALTLASGITLGATGASGNITLDATGGSISSVGGVSILSSENTDINDSLTTSGTTIITSDSDASGVGDLTVATSMTIDTQNAAATITANDIVLDGSLDTGTGALNLLVSDGGTIALGDADKDYDLSKLELSRITSGTTQIGNSTSGSITVDNVAEADSDGISGVLTLDATGDGSNIVFETIASVFNSLTAKADDGIDLSVDLTTDVGNMILEADNDNSADSAVTGDRIYLSGARTLTSAGNITLDATTTKISGTSTVDLSAVGAININDDMTSVAAITISADSDANGSGNFNLATGAELNSGGTQISLEANDLSLLGTINAGIANLLLWTSDAGSIGLGSVSGQGMSVSGAELQNMTASELHLGHADSGSIVVNGITVANSANIADKVLLQATGDNKSATFNSTASSFRTLTVEADDGITVGSNLTATVGDLKLEADVDNIADASDALTLASGITLSATGTSGNITLDATGGNISSVGGVSLLSSESIDINDSLTTAGTTIITADSDGLGDGDLTVAASMTVDTGNSTATITANDIILDGSLTTGTGALNLLVSDGGTIGLGDADKDYDLSKLEISRITSGTTQIGDSSSGSITVSNVSEADSDGIAGMLTLDASSNNATILFETVASVFNSLTAKADDGITVNVDLSTDTGNMILDADVDDLGDGDLTVATSKTIDTGNSTGTITANDIILDGSLSTGTGALNLLVSDGGTIGLGDADKDYDLSKLEISRITSGTTQIGDITSGSITVDNVAASDSNGISGMLTLDATRDDVTITFETIASTFNSLTAKADDGITINVDLTTDVGSMFLEGDADNSADTAVTGDRILLSGARTLTSAGDITLDATSNTGVEADSTLDLIAINDLNINDNVTTSGTTTITADSDGDGNGNLIVAPTKTIDTGGSAVTISVSDIILDGNLDVGSSELNLLVSDGGDIALGDAIKDYNLSKLEISRIISGVTNIGDSTSGSITVDNVSAADSNGIAGMLTLDATRDNANIVFEVAESTFNSLTAKADDGISLSVDLTTDTGDMILEGDSDNSADTAVTGDRIFLSGARTLTSAGNMTLDATSNTGIQADSTLILSSVDSLTINDNLTTSGTTIINVDSNDDGTGDLTLVTSMIIDTQNSTTSITANDIILDGSLSTGTGALNLLVSDGGAIGLGDADKDYYLSKAELSRIISGATQIGDVTSGSITVDNVSATDSNGIAGMLTLDATKNDSNIVFETAASIFNSLTAKADDGITLSVDLTTDTGDMILEGDSDNSADTAVTGDRIFLSGARTLTSAGNMTLDATSNTGIVANSTLTINAVDNLTVNDNLTTTGTTTIDVDSDDSGVGNLNLATSMSIDTQNSTATITANDIVLDGSLSTGTGALNLLVSDGGTIGLGDADKDYDLSKAELSRI